MQANYSDLPESREEVPYEINAIRISNISEEYYTNEHFLQILDSHFNAKAQLIYMQQPDGKYQFTYRFYTKTDISPHTQEYIAEFLQRVFKVEFF